MRNLALCFALSLAACSGTTTVATNDGQTDNLSDGVLPRPIVLQLTDNVPVFGRVPGDGPIFALTVLPPGQYVTAFEKLDVSLTTNPSFFADWFGSSDSETVAVYRVYYGDAGAAKEDQSGYIFGQMAMVVDGTPPAQPGFPVTTIADASVYSYPQESAFSKLFDSTAEDSVLVGTIPAGSTIQVLELAYVGSFGQTNWFYVMSDYGNGWVVGAQLSDIPQPQH